MSFVSISSYIFQIIASFKKKLPSGRKPKGRKPLISSTTMSLAIIMTRAIAPRIYLMAESICTAAKYFELLFLDSCRIGRLILNPVRECLQLSV